ncbi:replication protein [Sporosarcina sp. P34]|uniref:phage replisome organizer N-terminal domain-containing protein n=1 Tax=Sporosarcina sp. P34 TaxID=2048247 RepID=UPI000C164575|nr:phage replisome organizer N-terminal domain-containing protein [Sporosarcina sp. P34]PID16838.1 replication protein [Sporosarcina sp. P34]
MSNVKWIKLSTQMFEDEKIKLIEQMPDADTILIIWVKLLSQAGKTNGNGYIYLSENIPYTDEMLATIFGRPLNTIRLALETFKAFGMIEIDDEHFISIANWEKHQNVAGLEKIREQTRKRVAKHRENQRLGSNQKDVTLPVTQGNAIELELELEEELELERDKDILSDSPNQTADLIPYSQIIDYLNEQCSTKYRSSTAKTKELIRARWKEGFRVKDFEQVIDTKRTDWINDSSMNKFLRPITLFGTKFESYLNERSAADAKNVGRNDKRNAKSTKTYADGVNF